MLWSVHRCAIKTLILRFFCLSTTWGRWTGWQGFDFLHTWARRNAWMTFDPRSGTPLKCPVTSGGWALGLEGSLRTWTQLQGSVHRLLLWLWGSTMKINESQRLHLQRSEATAGTGEPESRAVHAFMSSSSMWRAEAGRLHQFSNVEASEVQMKLDTNAWRQQLTLSVLHPYSCSYQICTSNPLIQIVELRQCDLEQLWSLGLPHTYTQQVTKHHGGCSSSCPGDGSSLTSDRWGLMFGVVTLCSHMGQQLPSQTQVTLQDRSWITVSPRLRTPTEHQTGQEDERQQDSRRPSHLGAFGTTMWTSWNRTWTRSPGFSSSPLQPLVFCHLHHQFRVTSASTKINTNQNLLSFN